jgi:hypothetical protein
MPTVPVFDREPKRKGSGVTSAVVIVLRLALLYAAFLLVLYFIQDLLLYLPAKTSPDRLIPESKQIGLRLWPDRSTSDHYRGFVLEGNPWHRPKGTVIFVHGNAGNAMNRVVFAASIRDAGYRPILMEYPGYGARAGTPSEAALAKEVQEVVRLAAAETEGPVYLWGESMGAAVVASALGSDPTLPVAGVLLITPWNNLPDLAQSIYWFAPVKYMVRDRYDSAANLAKYRGPVVILMAEQDSVIPPTHSRALFDSLPEPKHRVIVPDADHNNWFRRAGSDWPADIMRFLALHGGTRASSPEAPSR